MNELNNPNVTLSTERLLLRPWYTSDAEAMYELAKDPRIGPIAGWPPHTSVQDSLDIITNRLSCDGVFAVLLKDSNSLIGCAGFVQRTDKPDTPCDEIEVGYWLGYPYWGFGYMHEAVNKLLHYAFTVLNYKTVWCSYYDGNIKSKNCMERCNFIYHHTEKDVPCELMGDTRTLHCTRMTKQQWIKYQNDKPKTVVLYIHGKGGSTDEAEHYKPLFPNDTVIGLDYKTSTPWETGKEIYNAIEALYHQGKQIIIIANSIGAFFTMNSNANDYIQKAYFISPIIDMTKLITNMMMVDNIKLDDLRSKREITTSFGETLSWDYYQYVLNNSIHWTVPTKILYGSNDDLTDIETVTTFANDHHAALNIMEGGEHWFHTSEQMSFLDSWILNT